MIPAGRPHLTGAGQLDLADGELEAVAERVVESDELPDAALAGLLRRAAGDLDPGQLQLLLGGVERVGVGEEEPGGEHAGLALDQGQAVVAVVGAQVGGAVLLRHQLQADDVDGEPHRVLQVGRAGADVGDVFECDHESVLLVRFDRLISCGQGWAGLAQVGPDPAEDLGGYAPPRRLLVVRQRRGRAGGCGDGVHLRRRLQDPHAGHGLADVGADGDGAVAAQQQRRPIAQALGQLHGPCLVADQDGVVEHRHLRADEGALAVQRHDRHPG